MGCLHLCVNQNLAIPVRRLLADNLLAVLDHDALGIAVHTLSVQVVDRSVVGIIGVNAADACCGLHGLEQAVQSVEQILRAVALESLVGLVKCILNCWVAGHSLSLRNQLVDGIAQVSLLGLVNLVG